MAVKHSNVYYISESDGTFIPSKSAVSVRNDFGADLFKHKGMIFEGSTGARVCGELGLADLMERFNGKPTEFAAVVSKYTAEHGLSPRYTQPEVKKADLFPPDDRRKLTKTLFQKERRWFTRYPLDTGPELYQMDKEFLKTGITSPLYTPCNGWMIPLSILPLDRFGKPDFDLLDFIKTKFETMLADPMTWADPSVASFLGRREDADAHNLPIRQAREAANRERTESKLTAGQKPAGISQEKPSILDKLDKNIKEIASQERTTPSTKKEQPDL